MKEVRIGTCGWSCQDWAGVFYPKGTAAGEYLSYYAEKYPVVEVDSTFYRSPSRQWLGGLLVLVAAALLASAKRLIIGANCVELVSKGRVVSHIPYQNVAETYAKGEGGAGVVGLRLRDRNDAETRVPAWTKDRYEIQVLIYGKPLEYVHHTLTEQLTAFRTRGG
jgi:hypothetical protein